MFEPRARAGALRGRRTAMSDYWNIEVAFADSHAVPVRFNTAATGLGKALDPNADTEDVRARAAANAAMDELV